MDYYLPHKTALTYVIMRYLIDFAVTILEKWKIGYETTRALLAC